MKGVITLIQIFSIYIQGFHSYYKILIVNV